MAVEFWKATEVEEIADKLIGSSMTYLTNVPIGYLFREKAVTTQGKTRLGYCAKQPAGTEVLHGFKYVITIAHDQWNKLEASQKEALVYHELRHIVIGEDEKTGDTKYSVNKHDVEMFFDELQKYGPWKADLAILMETAGRVSKND